MSQQSWKPHPCYLDYPFYNPAEILKRKCYLCGGRIECQIHTKTQEIKKRNEKEQEK